MLIAGWGDYSSNIMLIAGRGDYRLKYNAYSRAGGL